MAEAVLDGGQDKGVDSGEGGGIVVGFGREEGEIGGGARIQIVGQGAGRQSMDKQGAGVAADTEMNGEASVGKMDGKPGARVPGPDNGKAKRHDLSESHFVRLAKENPRQRANLHSMARVTCEFEVYTYQIDFARHVSNIVYIQWLEIGRLKLLEAVGLSVACVAERGITPIVAATSIVYQRPVHFGDRVTLEAWVGDFGKASAMVHYRFTNQRGEEVAEATQRGLFVRISDGKPVRLGEEDRVRFAPFVERRKPVRID